MHLLLLLPLWLLLIDVFVVSLVLVLFGCLSFPRLCMLAIVCVLYSLLASTLVCFVSVVVFTIPIIVGLSCDGCCCYACCLC